jgi:hypothetical protein
MVGGLMAKYEAPLGELVELYEEMGDKPPSGRKPRTQAERLEQAAELASNPMAVAKMFERDVKRFRPYDMRKKQFHSGAKDRDTKDFARSSKTRMVAEALIEIGEKKVSVAREADLSFTYVDREIVSARTPGGIMRTFSGEARSPTTAPKLDLLLAGGDGLPIVGELKVGDDRDPFYALIQALAHAAMLVTPNQLARLRQHYKGAFSGKGSKIGVYVVLVGEASGTNRPEFQEQATKLAEGLRKCKPFTRHVKRLAQVKLFVGATSSCMPRVERDPERGRAAAAKLKALGVKGILIKAAEQGYITQLACKMPECFCPEELGGACHFEPVSDELSDWMPTHEHFPRSKREGGHRDVDNAILAHRLCNRIDYSVSVGRPYAKDLERVRKAREEAIRRNNERP